MHQTQKTVILFVRIVRFFNLGMGIFILVVLLPLMYTSAWSSVARLAFAAAVNFSIYAGLTKKRSWVVPLIVWVSVAQIVLSFVGDYQTIPELIVRRIFGILGVAQLYFFTHKAVRAHFNNTEATLF